MVTKQSMRGRNFDTRGAITYTFSGQVIETQPTIPAPPSPEPPVTPKIIATIDVFENHQLIVGVHTDPETGDSTVLLPKSFEVDGIPQPLDAIDTEGYLGAYTFETLGEHTITYEFDNPTIIPAFQFNQVNLISVQLLGGITNIGDYAFINCPFTNIEIPESVRSIGEHAFEGCYHMITCNIRNGVISIGNKAFYGCSSLSSITIPDSVTSIGSGAFSGCESLTSVTIPSGVTSISNYVFNHCPALATCNIPSGVTSIGDASFSQCGLTSVTIPDNVTSIGDNAFSSCPSLSSTIINATIPPTLGSDAFFGPCTIFVPSESVDAYKTAWSEYASRIQAIS